VNSPKHKWLTPLIVVAMLLSQHLFMPYSQANESLVSRLPKAERSVFVLDISSSTNVKSNWNKSLRPSIIKKLSGEPFGFPTAKGQKKIKAPVDIFVSSITANSIDAPLFPIITMQDAQKIWGLIDQIGTNPTQKRLEVITRDIFGGNGAFTLLSEGFSAQPISVPTLSNCTLKVVASFSSTMFMRDLSKSEKDRSAKTLCELAISISERVKRVDSYFDNPDCGGYNACSDVVGAFLSMSYAAADLYESSPKSQLCIAIASDMLNAVPGMKKDSPLNSRKVVENASSISEAKEKGELVAQLTGISFPKKLPVRVFILGQGSGKNPLSLDKNAMLTAYWQGFLQVAGISKSKPSPSLDQACSK
jgi:hypothetical protein